MTGHRSPIATNTLYFFFLGDVIQIAGLKWNYMNYSEMQNLTLDMLRAYFFRFVKNINNANVHDRTIPYF